MLGNRRSHGEGDVEEEGAGGLDLALEGGGAQALGSAAEVQPAVLDGDEGAAEGGGLPGVPEGEGPGGQGHPEDDRRGPEDDLAHQDEAGAVQARHGSVRQREEGVGQETKRT
jgi:hypothetical protein